jgi:hypothetical protein
VTRSAVIVGVTLLLTIVTMTAAQPAGEPNCNIVELYNPEGWAVPGLSNATVTKQVRNKTRDDQEVSVDVLQPRNRVARLPLVSFIASHPGRLEVREQPIDVIEIRRYSIRGNVFAYRLSAGQVSIEGHRRVPIAAAEIVMYYDMDGSGRFTIREYASKVPYALKVPDWVRSK